MIGDLYVYKARVVRVIDGDTFEADVDLGFRVSLRLGCRLDGIDAPEVRGETRAPGMVSKDWLKERVEARTVTIWSSKWEKYGRALVWVWEEEIKARTFDATLNREMIRLELAKEYDGGRR